MPGVAYDPNDPTQAKFLASLKVGESGTSQNPYLGTGGTDLSGAATDQYGFPQWSGFGGSHAAGAYQFQPGTWDAVASQHGLNFGNPNDQNAAAWYLAQDTYAQKTGGSLIDALKSGNLNSVQSALVDVWPSVTGNAASPGLAQSFMKGIGSFFGGSNPISATTSGGGSGGIVGNIETFVVRFGLIIVGGIVILVALWQLLSSQGVVPSPGETVKTVAKVAAVA